MKIAVTGAGGYIGRHVVAKLLDCGHTVIAGDIKTDEIDERAQKVNINIFSTETEDVYKVLETPDVLLHLAWRDGFVHNSNAHMEDLSKHYSFLSRMLSSGLKHLAVMGTMHEVGYHEGAIDENTPCNPISMYGIAKDALRRSMLLLAKDRKFILQWLRGYYIYGDDLKNHSIFAKLTAANMESKQTFPFTSGKNKYDFISIEELAKQISAAITQDEITGIINCCTGVPISLGEKVESYIKEHNMNIKLEYGAFPDRPYDSPCVYGDSEKIKRILNKNSKNPNIESKKTGIKTKD